MTVLWILVGILIGALGAVPVVRRLLRRARARARAAERRARESERLAELGSLTGGLAHEIKNPLSTIGLNAQLLGEAIEEADIADEHRTRLRKRVDALAREADRLKGILTDFLQFAGRVRLDPQPRDLAGLVEEVSDFFHPQCEQAGVMMRVQAPRQPVPVRVDEGLLKQALLNLMINAVQAMSSAASGDTAERGVTQGELMLRVDADDEDARVHVIDTGPGIDPERLKTIFHPYVSHRAGGTGLGLPTARRIIEEHGGRLTAHSTPGSGSDFVIQLPRH